MLGSSLARNFLKVIQIVICILRITSRLQEWETTKRVSSALWTMDDASFFLVIRPGPKTSECEKNVTVVSTVTGL